MCIVLISTALPDYPLILANNRDEFLSRPTAAARFWDAPHEHVLGGRDRLRDVQGTWLGVTRDGRVGVLTNFHEPNAQAAQGLVSRGAMVNAYLTPQPADVPDARSFAEQLITGAGARGAGGFSLVCGRIGGDLAVVSNRMKGLDEIKWISHAGETVVLSNAAYGDRSWPKVEDGERLMKELVDAAATTTKDLSKEALIEQIYELLNRDTLPPPKPESTFADRMAGLRKTIFVPAIQRPAAVPDSGRADEEQGKGKHAPNEETEDVYATQKQTVVLVDRHGDVTYVEKTLYHGLRRQDAPTIRKYEFRLPDGWQP